VFPIEIPPLRERLEDISLFVEAFLNNLNQFSLKEIKGIHPLVVEAFEKYAWPGNIRELENLEKSELRILLFLKIGTKISYFNF
jgi:transcriptional regulator with PAS, ATPase and Fis domain